MPRSVRLALPGLVLVGLLLLGLAVAALGPVARDGSDAPDAGAAREAPAVAGEALAVAPGAGGGHARLEAPHGTAAGEASPAALHVAGIVVDPHGAGVPGATVEALPRGPEPEFGPYLMGLFDVFEGLASSRPPRPPLGRATTDASGRFRIDGLPDGATVLVARAEGFGKGMTWTSPVPEGAEHEERVELTAADLLEGVLVTEEGTPLSGVKVYYVSGFALALGVSDVDALESETTDEGGRFRFDRRLWIEKATMPFGEWALVAAPPGRPLTYRIVGRDETQVRLVVPDAATLRAKVLVTPDGPPVPGARVGAMVFDPADPRVMTVACGTTDAEGVARLAVQAGVLGGAMVSHPHHPEAFVWSTPEGGSMTVDDGVLLPKDRRVAPGENDVTFRIRGGFELCGRVTAADGRAVAGARCRAGGRETTTDASGAYLLFVPVAADAAAVAFSVEAAGLVQPPESERLGRRREEDRHVIHDVVLDAPATIEGRVLDADGARSAVSSVAVLRRGEAPPDPNAIPILAHTDAEGRYRIERVWAEPGLRVCAWAPDHTATTSAPFDASAGGTVQVDDLRLLRGATLRVRVLDAKGEPVEAAVHIERLGEDREARDVAGDESGVPETGAWRRGVLFVTATSPKHASATRRVDLAQDGERREIEIRLAEGAVVAGRVVDEEGEPVAHARVRVADRSALADDEGRFRVAGVPRGATDVRLFAAGRAMQSVPCEAPREDLEVVLAPPVADAARRMREIDARLAETEQALRRVTEVGDYVRLADLLEALATERRALEGVLEDPPAAGGCGAACGAGPCGR